MKRKLAMLLAAAMVFSAVHVVPAAVAEGGTRVITDGLGREVEVPETVERIVTLGMPPEWPPIWAWRTRWFLSRAGT